MNVHVVYDKIIEILKNNKRDTSEECIKGKNNKDGSISVNVFKNLAIKIVFKPKSNYLIVKSEYNDLFLELDIITHSIKSEKDSIRYHIFSIKDIEIIENILLKIYDDCEAVGQEFGCCHRYEECSDKKECIHPDKVHSQCCIYRKNLEAGRIFYGINANQHLQNMQQKIEKPIDNKNNSKQLSFI